MNELFEGFLIMLSAIFAVAISIFLILNLLLFIIGMMQSDYICSKKVVYIIPMAGLGCWAAEKK